MPLFQIRITLFLLLLPFLAFGQAFDEDYFQPHEFGLQNNIELISPFRGRKQSELGLSYSWSISHQYLFRRGLGINSFISYGDRHYTHKFFGTNSTRRNLEKTTNYEVVEIGVSIVLSPFRKKRLFFSFGGGLVNFFQIDFSRNGESDFLSQNILCSPETIRAFEEYSPILFGGLKYSIVNREDIRLFLASDCKVDFKSHSIGGPHLFQTFVYSFSIGFNVKIKPDKKSLFFTSI